MIRAVRLLAALAVAAGLAGCDLLAPSKTPFKAIDVTGSPIGGALALTDHAGKPRTLADFRGKVVVVFFGFTHCPDVCPTALADAAAALRQLGADASRVQVLFVTLDPKRDTPELLAQYVPAFDPSFIGLYGDEAATTKAKKDFKVYSNVREGSSPGAYTLDHSAQLFVFDREGRIRLVVSPGTSPQALASDLRILLNS